MWLCFEAHVETEEEKGKVRQGPFDVDNSFLVVISKNPYTNLIRDEEALVFRSHAVS